MLFTTFHLTHVVMFIFAGLFEIKTFILAQNYFLKAYFKNTSKFFEMLLRSSMKNCIYFWNVYIVCFKKEFLASAKKNDNVKIRSYFLICAHVLWFFSCFGKDTSWMYSLFHEWIYSVRYHSVVVWAYFLRNPDLLLIPYRKILLVWSIQSFYSGVFLSWNTL